MIKLYFLLILNYNNDKLKLIGSRSCICENQTETYSSSSKKKEHLHLHSSVLMEEVVRP